MTKGFEATATISIRAPAAKVWDALTNPVLIKKYLFGTDVVSDWRVGSPIHYRGKWQGKKYEDKGIILAIEPEKLLMSTYWSSMTGKPDVPENYQTVSYFLETHGIGTTLTITQENAASAGDATHSAENWKMVLAGMKKLLEG